MSLPVFGARLATSPLGSGSSSLWDTSDDGTDVLARLPNSRNTAGADSIVEARVGGTSAGDAVFRSKVLAGNSWSWGLDNSVTDNFVISSGDVLGTNNVFSASTNAASGTDVQNTTGNAKARFNDSVGTQIQYGLSEYIQIDTTKVHLVGDAVLLAAGGLATTATSSFPYMPSCAGVPTGVPNAFANLQPFVYDRTNDDFYVYNAGWHVAAMV